MEVKYRKKEERKKQKVSKIEVIVGEKVNRSPKREFLRPPDLW